MLRQNVLFGSDLSACVISVQYCVQRHRPDDVDKDLSETIFAHCYQVDSKLMISETVFTHCYSFINESTLIIKYNRGSGTI